MGTGGMLEHPNRLFVHGFGSTIPRLVCVWLQINDHQPHARTDSVDDTKLPQYTVFKKFATHNDGDAPPLRVSGKDTKNCTCIQRATTQDDVTSMSGSAVKRAAERPPVTAKGVPEKRKTVPLVGAHSRFSESVPFLLPVHLGFQCPEVPMSRCFDSGFQCLGVPMSQGRGKLVVLIKS